MDESNEKEMPKNPGPIVLGGGKKGEANPEEEGEADMSEAEFSAAKDVKQALQSGDDEDFALALKTFIHACGMY